MPKTDISEEEERELAIQRTESDDPTEEMRIVPPEVVTAETSHRPSFGGRRNTPSPMMKGLSTALMQGAFEKFGQAFTASGDVAQDIANESTRMKPFRDSGATVASRLEDRWFRMEYENFQKNEVEPFIYSKKMMLAAYKQQNDLLNDGMVLGPDGPVQQFDITTAEGRTAARRARTSLWSNFYSQNADMDMSLANEAYKYPHNPIIDARIQAIVKAGSDGLMQVGAPKQKLESEGLEHGMMMDERRAGAAEQQARATQKMADRAMEPTSVAEALKDRNVGVPGIMPWAEDKMMNSPQAGAYLQEGRATLEEQAHQARIKEQLADGTIKRAKDYDRSEVGPNYAEVQALLDQNAAAIQKAATVHFVATKNPKAAEEAKKYTPQYFDWQADAESVTGEKKIISDKRVSTKERKKHIKEWEQPIANKLREYMEDPTNETDIESAISYIVDEWLPQAVTGAIDSDAPPHVLAAQAESTVGYRTDLQNWARRFLERNFHKISGVAAEKNPSAAKKARARGRRGLVRGFSGLLDD